MSKLRRFFIGIIAVSIVAGIVLISQPKHETSNVATVQPTTPEARDKARQRALEALAEAIRASTRLHAGIYPFVVPKVETGICSASSVSCKKAKLVDLSQVISDGVIASIPNDPNGGSGQYSSGYTLRRNADGSIDLRAPRTEGAEPISVRL